LKEETGLEISTADCLTDTMSTLALWEASFFLSCFLLKRVRYS